MKNKFNKDQILQKLLIWILIIIIPLIQYNKLLDISLLPKFLSLTLVFSLFLIFIIIKKNKIDLSFNIAHIIFIIYFIYTGISIFYSPLKFDALFVWSKIFLLITGILIFQIDFDKNILIINASKAFSILGITISFWGIIQFIIHCYGGISHEELYNIKARFSHKNLFAEILFITIPFSLFNTRYYNGVWRSIGIVSFLLCFSLIIVLMTRAVWIATIISSILTILVLIYHFKPQKRSLLRLLYGLIGVLIFTFIIVSGYSRIDSFTTFQKQSQKIFNLHYGSVQDRLELWSKTNKLIKEKPFVGHGLASWKIKILKEGNENLRSKDQLTFYQRPHNDYLWILSENGIIGLLIYVLILVFFYKYLFKELKVSDNGIRHIYPLIFLGFTGYLVFSFFSFPKERIDHLIFLIIAFSIILNNKLKKSIHIKTYWLIPILLILIGFSIISINRIIGESQIKKVYAAKEVNNWNKVIYEACKIPQKIYVIDPVSTPVAWYIGNANFNLKNYDKAFEYYKTAYSINPYHIHILNNLGICYVVKGDLEKALKTFEEALNISPDYIEALMNKCAVLYSKKQFLKAYEPFHKITPSDNPKYKLFADKIIPVKYEEICSKINIVEITDVLENIRNTPEWMWHIYNKSIQNEITFKKQILIDAVYFLYNMENKITYEEAQKLKEELNL